jgi:hypothetical protein
VADNIAAGVASMAELASSHEAEARLPSPFFSPDVILKNRSVHKVNDILTPNFLTSISTSTLQATPLGQATPCQPTVIASQAGAWRKTRPSNTESGS